MTLWEIRQHQVLRTYAEELYIRWYDAISDAYQYVPEMLRQLRLENENGAGG